MKYAKILGLLAVAATALMAFAATASATTVTAPSGTAYTGVIKGEAENGHVSLHNPQANIECASSVEGEVKTHGSAVTAEGPITALSFSNCTNGWTVAVNVKGTLIAHTTSGGNGTLTSNEATVTATLDGLGINCRYKTTNTDIGTLTGAPSSSGHATLDISASIPFHSGSIFCGTADSAWTGSYKVTSPTGLVLS